MDELSEEDKLTVERARKIQRFMSQPFAVAQVFTGIEGRLVSLKDTIQAFKEILNGDHDALPENAFYSTSPSRLRSNPVTDMRSPLQWSVVSMTSRPRPLSSPRKCHKQHKHHASSPRCSISRFCILSASIDRHVGARCCAAGRVVAEVEVQKTWGKIEYIKECNYNELQGYRELDV